jgi:hypothetical protein
VRETGYPLGYLHEELDLHQVQGLLDGLGSLARQENEAQERAVRR